MDSNFGCIDTFPRVLLASTPTPIDSLTRLSKFFDGPNIFVKRDDCTGLALGGNKARTLEFYIGDALHKGADTVLITGSVQSNFACMAAAASRKYGLNCHVQLEDRVPNVDQTHMLNGNVLLEQMFGATVHHYPDGEDEQGADKQMTLIADQLTRQGAKPYIIPLSPSHPPIGALGYMLAAREICQQIEKNNLDIDEIYLGSGSGQTHIGLLLGLRALGSTIRVVGVCIRRSAEQQTQRLLEMSRQLAAMIGIHVFLKKEDIYLIDSLVAPGYGQQNDNVLNAVKLCAQEEGLLVDPVYTGKVAAGMFACIRSNTDEEPRNIMLLHAGGNPIIFAYQSMLQDGF